MELGIIGSSIILLALGLLHSLLGEAAILKPLFRKAWSLDIERYAVERILRFAWHLTTFAWVGFAAILLGFSAPQVIAWTCIASGLLVFFMLRGHLAWPLFLLAAPLIWEATDTWPGGTSLAWIAIALGVLIAIGAGVLHLYWAAGGKAGLDAVIPKSADSSTNKSPGPLACVGVSALLGLWAWCLASAFQEQTNSWVEWILWASVAFLGLRAIGDGKQVGFTKSNHSSKFARWDDALYSPLVVMMLFSSLAALKLIG